MKISSNRIKTEVDHFYLDRPKLINDLILASTIQTHILEANIQYLVIQGKIEKDLLTLHISSMTHFVLACCATF